jgi:hypothetical protein
MLMHQGAHVNQATVRRIGGQRACCVCAWDVGLVMWTVVEAWGGGGISEW